jgi:hypothetical protein
LIKPFKCWGWELHLIQALVERYDRSQWGPYFKFYSYYEGGGGGGSSMHIFFKIFLLSLHSLYDKNGYNR